MQPEVGGIMAKRIALGHRAPVNGGIRGYLQANATTLRALAWVFFFSRLLYEELGGLAYVYLPHGWAEYPAGVLGVPAPLAYRALHTILRQALAVEGATHTANGPTELQAILANIEALVPGAAAQALLDTSVVIYCHNDASATQECLTSIQQNASPQSYEIILVDDASTDATRELEITHNRTFRIHRNPEFLGMMESYRLGAQLASAPYVLLMDQHSLATPEWTEPLKDTVSIDASETTSETTIVLASEHATTSTHVASPIAIPRNAFTKIRNRAIAMT